jgi:hypothetical protein
MNGAMDELEAAELARIAAAVAAQPPRIDDSTFPERERQQVDSILLLLGGLSSLIEQFRADLELFDYAEQNLFAWLGRDERIGRENAPERRAWLFIASRDAAMTIWEFSEALKFIRRALEICTRLRTPAKDHALKAAIDRFGAAFPFAKDVRHATAHPVEQIATPEERKKNTLRGAGVLIQGGLVGRKFTHSKNGREVSFEISSATILTLETVKNAVFDVFR